MHDLEWYESNSHQSDIAFTWVVTHAFLSVDYEENGTSSEQKSGVMVKMTALAPEWSYTHGKTLILYFSVLVHVDI